MKKLVLFFIFSIHSSFFALNLIDETEKSAQKADRTGDFFENKFNLNNKEVNITSYFNLDKHKAIIEDIFKPNEKNTYDFRSLEKIYCKEAIATMKFHRFHRGKIGWLAGFCIGTIAGATLFDQFKKFRSEKKD